jgi:propionyl-CoA carboxylase alpha chain
VIDKIIAACKETGAEAVHPGYGFLSEREAFPKALEAGIVFIGPNPDARSRHGRQDRIQEGRRQGRVSTVPGHLGEIEDAHAVKIADEIGYPVMIKASAGGGGKGMRIAWNRIRGRGGLARRRPRPNPRSATTASSSRNSSSIRATSKSRCWATSTATSSISASANARSSAAIRRSSRRRRRRCSTRRPARKMGEQAVALAKAVNYDSAGTVEFVAGQDKSFFFLEMNTRLQVEHPVTELITGIDLVEQMIRVAAGEKLAASQSDVKLNRLGGREPHLCRGPLPQFPALDRAAGPLSPAGRGPARRRHRAQRHRRARGRRDLDLLRSDDRQARHHAPTRAEAIEAQSNALDSLRHRRHPPQHSVPVGADAHPRWRIARSGLARPNTGSRSNARTAPSKCASRTTA